jgi:hypothetical protein
VRVFRVEKISSEDKHKCFYDAEELDGFRAEYEMTDLGLDFEYDVEERAEEDEEFDYHDLIGTYYPYDQWESFSDDEEAGDRFDKDLEGR